MVRRRKALQSALELMEDQYFQAVETMESFHRLAKILRDQLVTRECLEPLSDLGEEIQAWACYSELAYRHPEEWLVYVDEREEVAIAGLVGGIKDRRDDSDHQTPI